ncbi:hypothetical protein [Sphingomonas mollis]|uniref:hypothetical protein n=1 Tax=Sphingomonas mollis TaxID=2795726 RepID=UPI001E34F250|nr:hypothetical protein [Sphingomonas sp. BT553]
MTADNSLGVYFENGIQRGSTLFNIKRRLNSTDYNHSEGTNKSWPRALATGDVVEFLNSGTPRQISVTLNRDVVFGPFPLSSTESSEPGAVWGDAWTTAATHAGARSNSANRPVTVGQVDMPMIVTSPVLRTSGELIATVAYVGSPDAFRARVVKKSDTAAVVSDWQAATVTATTGTGNASIKLSPTVTGTNIGTDVVLEVQHMKNGSPVANASGKVGYYSRPSFMPLAMGYNLGRSVGDERPIVNDVTKEMLFESSQSAYRTPQKYLLGEGHFITNAGCALTNPLNDTSFTISSNSDGTRHDVNWTGDTLVGTRFIGLGGKPRPTSLKYFPNHQDPASINGGILPQLSAADMGGGFRDLDFGGANAELSDGLFNTPENRSKPTSENYINNGGLGFPAADGLPYEVMVAVANQQ